MHDTIPTLQDLPEVPVQETQENNSQNDIPVNQAEQPGQDTITSSSAAPQISNEQRNFEALRQAKETVERERDEYRRQLQAQQAPKAASKPELGDDDLVEGRHIRESENRLRKELTETRLKVQYPDFDAVVNTNNIAQLRTAYPELAATLSQSNDLYNMGSSAYTLIKKLGIYDGKNHESHRQVVQDNTAKPRPLSSVSPQQGESPLSHANAFANGLTPELKKKLWRELQESRSRT